MNGINLISDSYISNDGEIKTMKLTELDVLGKLLIWQKLVILGVIAFVMVAIPTTLYYNGQQHYIDTIIAERGGLEPANNVIALLKEVQKHRDLAFASLSGNQAAEDNRKKAKSDVDAQIAKTEKALGSINYPGMAEAWKLFKDEWVRQASNISTKAMTGEKIWDAQTQLVGQIFSIQDLIMSGSTMDLDPDTETYYLIQVVMVNTPALAEKLAQARHYGQYGDCPVAQRRQKEFRSRIACYCPVLLAVVTSLSLTLKTLSNVRSKTFRN